MKIRTDFVTNSSSYSTAEVIIDNPLLLEILQKYKDLGTFVVDDPVFFMGNLEESMHEDLVNDFQFSTDTPLLVSNPDADYYDFWNDVPYQLSEIVGSILYCIQEGRKVNDENLFEQMTRELEEKREEILLAFRKAVWKYEDSDNEGEEYEYDGYLTDTKLFVFDPKTGEQLVVKTEAGPGEDEEIEEGFVFKEKRTINGEVVHDFDFLADFPDHANWSEIRILHGKFVDEEEEGLEDEVDDTDDTDNDDFDFNDEDNDDLTAMFFTGGF